MKLINMAIALLAISFLSACASKSKVASTTTQTETPATMTATQKPAEDVKKVGKHSKKSKKAAGTEKSVAGATEVNCKSGSDERKLVVQAKGDGCELMYTKAGETKAIASQISGNEKCEEVIAKVKEHLTAANFTCQ